MNIYVVYMNEIGKVMVVLFLGEGEGILLGNGKVFFITRERGCFCEARSDIWEVEEWQKK